MIVSGWIVATLVAATAIAAAVSATPKSEDEPVQLAQLSIRESIMVLRLQRRGVHQPQTVWKERKGPKCVGSADIAGAIVTGDDKVDLMLKGGKRVRAQFRSSCPALDFYSGFYVRPTQDRKICADRDAVHARSGGECEIDKFRELVPDRR